MKPSTQVPSNQCQGVTQIGCFASAVGPCLSKIYSLELRRLEARVKEDPYGSSNEACARRHRDRGSGVEFLALSALLRASLLVANRGTSMAAINTVGRTTQHASRSKYLCYKPGEATSISQKDLYESHTSMYSTSFHYNPATSTLSYIGLHRLKNSPTSNPTLRFAFSQNSA
jgi:hypothetical protein